MFSIAFLKRVATRSKLPKHCRAFAAVAMDTKTDAIAKMTNNEWSNAFSAEMTKVVDAHKEGASHDVSAQCMRNLLQSGLLRHTDIATDSARFFLAHRLIATHAPLIGPGFWIRFTVHYNLCMGTVVGLGNDDQIKLLDDMQEKGQLGCFSLTEKFAGVNSGLIVNTTADYNKDNGTFTINTPNEGAKKNWISQGFVADKTVVVADLRIEGKSVGPHAFLMDLRTNGEVVAGVDHGDMGGKTVGNDLDNAWISFKDVVLPADALLSKYADIVDGSYVQRVKGMPVFHMIGQRLFTGRVAVAQAALMFTRTLFNSTKEYTDAKLCWSPAGSVPLSRIPQLAHLYQDAEEQLTDLEQFAQQCEKQLTQHLQNGTLPPVSLVEGIATLKVKAVESAISLCHDLRNEVGSYALMHSSGFGQTDFLQCCKFAEGDSRILMQKMARDRMRAFEKKVGPSKGSSDAAIEAWKYEDVLCEELARNMSKEEGGKLQVWDNQYKAVYALAEATMNRSKMECMSPSSA